MKEKPAWRQFEQIIEKLHRAFFPDAEVKTDEKILGQESKRRRQIDISLRQKIGLSDVLLIVECKKRKRKVDVETLQAFVGKKHDVKADIAIMVSSSGFTKAAREVADGQLISLFTFRDTEQDNWPSGIRVPVSIRLWVLQLLALQRIDDDGQVHPLPAISRVTLRDGDNIESASLASLLCQAWADKWPKSEGKDSLKILVEHSTSNRKGLLLAAELEARLVKAVREGRLHFNGLIREGEPTAHSQGFRIDAEGPPKFIHSDNEIFRHDGGYGLSIETSMVLGDESSKALQFILFEAKTSIEMKAAGKIEIPLD